MADFTTTQIEAITDTVERVGALAALASGALKREQDANREKKTLVARERLESMAAMLHAYIDWDPETGKHPTVDGRPVWSLDDIRDELRSMASEESW